MKRIITSLLGVALMMGSSVAASERLFNHSSRYCLDTDGHAINKGQVRMWECTFHPNQLWSFEKLSQDSNDYRIRNKASGFCLDTDGRAVNKGQVRMWECANHPNQIWSLEKRSENSNDYRIRNKASGFCLDTDGRAVNKGQVRMWECANHSNQLWARRTIAAADKPFLEQANACLKLENTESTNNRPVTCIGEGGHDYGSAGKTFQTGDNIMLLLKLRNLPIGKHSLKARTYLYNSSQRAYRWAKEYDVTHDFSSTNKSWAFFFPAPAKKTGQWMVEFFLDKYPWVNMEMKVEYCVDCMLE